MDYSTPGFPVHHQLPEPVKTHVHPVSDTIQPSHPLSSPSPPAFNLSQHHGLSMELEPHHMLVVTHQLNDTPTGAMTAPRLTIKNREVGGGPILGNPLRFPRITGIILPFSSL